MDKQIIENIEKLYRSHIVTAILYFVLIVIVVLLVVGVIKFNLLNARWKNMLRNDVALRAKGKLHFPNTKVLVNQGLFVFLGVKNIPPSPWHLFPDLLDLNLRL